MSAIVLYWMVIGLGSPAVSSVEWNVPVRLRGKLYAYVKVSTWCFYFVQQSHQHARSSLGGVVIDAFAR